MKLKEFIVVESIVPELSSTDRDGAIGELVGSLVRVGALPESVMEDVVRALIQREKSGSTGFGKGVAVPHVRHERIERMVGTVGCSARGIDFAALDNQPVYSMVLLLSPQDRQQEHLQAMNIIFSNLQEDTFRRFLRQAETREAIIELLEEADQAK